MIIAYFSRLSRSEMAFWRPLSAFKEFSTLFTPFITVAWSLPPKMAPIRPNGRSSLTLMRYMAMCRAKAICEVLILPVIWYEGRL